MSQSALTPRESSTPQTNPERCPYCGAPLMGEFYFCLSCATPFQDVEDVLPRMMPEHPTDGELVRLKAPQVQTLFWTYFAVVIGVAVLAYVLVGERRPDVQILVQTAALLVATSIFGALYRRALWVQFKRFGLAQPAALVALGLLAPLLFINWAYHGWLVRELDLHDQLPLVQLREIGFSEAGLILFFCIFPAVVEEIAFRGLVQHWLQVALKPWHAIVFASFLFTVLHFSVLSFPYLFAVGMLLGWAKWKTGSLYPSMLIHFVHNLVVIELFTW